MAGKDMREARDILADRITEWAGEGGVYDYADRLLRDLFDAGYELGPKVMEDTDPKWARPPAGRKITTLVVPLVMLVDEGWTPGEDEADELADGVRDLINERWGLTGSLDMVQVGLLPLAPVFLDRDLALRLQAALRQAQEG